jgi:cullin 3
VYKSVYDKGVILFRDKVIRYLPVRDRLTQTLLDTIAEERREKTVEK